MQQDQYGYTTNATYQIARGAKLRQYTVETRPRGIEKMEEYRYLRQKHQNCNEHHQERVYGTFGNYGAQRLGK